MDSAVQGSDALKGDFEYIDDVTFDSAPFERIIEWKGGEGGFVYVDNKKVPISRLQNSGEELVPIGAKPRAFQCTVRLKA